MLNKNVNFINKEKEIKKEKEVLTMKANNKKLRWAQLVADTYELASVKETCNGFLRDKDFVKQYSNGPVHAGDISFKEWRALCAEHKFPFAPEYFSSWKLQVSLPSISMTRAKSYKPDANTFRYLPAKRYNPETDEYEYAYYTSKKYPFWKALKKLQTIGIAGSSKLKIARGKSRLRVVYRNAGMKHIRHRVPAANSIVNAFRDVYYIYDLVYNARKISNALTLYKADAAILNLMFIKYKDAQEMLYAYNASYKTAVQDTKQKCNAMEFEHVLHKEAGQHYTKGFTESETQNIITAAVVYDLGVINKDLNDIINKHPETFVIKEYCTVPMEGIAEEPDNIHPWYTYHPVTEGSDYNRVTCLGKFTQELFTDDLKAQLLQCYNWMTGLSEEDREPFYRKVQDCYGVTRTIKSIDDYIEYAYGEHAPIYRDFLTPLYDESDDAAPTNNKCGKYVNAEASFMYLFDTEEDVDELIDIVDIIKWVGDEDTETPQVTVCGKTLGQE